MKFKVKEYVGPNTVIGETAKGGLVRAKIAINDRPKVGDEIERPNASVSEVPKAEPEPAPAPTPVPESTAVKVPGSEKPKK